MVAVEPDVAADEAAGIGGEAHDAVRGDGFAGAGLADDAQHLAGADIQRDVVEGLDLARGGEEGQALVLDVHKVVGIVHVFLRLLDFSRRGSFLFSHCFSSSLSSSSSGRRRRAGRRRRG
jgi:hypothetical protein